MAGPGFSLLNLARGLTLAALLCFFLPWATVSCSSARLNDTVEFRMSGAPSEAIARPSGFALATGGVRLIQVPPSAGAAPPANPFARPDPLAASGGLLILAALALPFLLRGPRGRLAALGATLLAGGFLCLAIFVRLPRTAQDYAAALISGDAARGTRLDPAELVRMIEVRTEPGFWLTLAALAGAAVLLGLSARGRSLPAA
ncbi:MAG TPA: hypothetical protein VLK25_11130 [Allosphingosinicella sp.]|nr:hypothetical protein [Allosphingosinicella sp.]